MDLSLALYSVALLLWGILMLSISSAQFRRRRVELGRLRSAGSPPVVSWKAIGRDRLLELVQGYAHQAASLCVTESGELVVAAHYQELKKAGLRSEKALGLFLLGLNWAKKGCLALACISLLFLKPLTAALMLAACLAALHFGPTLWLSWRQARRLREIGGKLPLMAALVKLGASAGLDLGAALKRTCRVFAEHYPQHELTYELSALQRRAMTGYSWTEALHQMTLRVEHPAWAKLSSILSQGIIQGGDRRRELEALIAQLDRENGSNLELAIAAFPVKMAALSALAVIGFWLLG